MRHSGKAISTRLIQAIVLKSDFNGRFGRDREPDGRFSLRGLPPDESWTLRARAFVDDALRPIWETADGLADRGWYVNRQDRPAGIHLKVDPTQDAVVHQYLTDLREVVKEVVAGAIRNKGAAIRYA